MIRHCDGTDPNLIADDSASACACGLLFDDEDRSVIAPHGPITPNPFAVGGPTRVYWVPNLRDPAAPTRAELEGGTDLGTMITSDLEFTADGRSDEDWRLPCAPITLMIRADVSQLVRAFRKIARNIDRARLREHPRRTAMHAEYARRRKARSRRR